METVHLLVSTWLDRRPVSWIWQFIPSNSQRSPTLCALELNGYWRRREWHYRKETDGVQDILYLFSCEHILRHLPPYSQREAEGLLWSSIIGCNNAPACSDSQNQETDTQNQNTGHSTLFVRLGSGGMTDTVNDWHNDGLLPSLAVQWILVLVNSGTLPDLISSLCKRISKGYHSKKSLLILKNIENIETYDLWKHRTLVIDDKH